MKASLITEYNKCGANVSINHPLQLPVDKMILHCLMVCVIGFVDHTCLIQITNSSLLLHFVTDDAGRSVCCASCAKDFCGDTSYLAPVSFCFSTLSISSVCFTI
jgi:hypothetical protein